MSKKYNFDQKDETKILLNFFKNEKSNLNSFGRTVNQTFEAYVLVRVIKWFQENGFETEIINPKSKLKVPYFKLKFSTRGKPSGYTYVKVKKDEIKYQIRHGLRVATQSADTEDDLPRANICCDIAIIYDELELDSFVTDQAVPNKVLVSFGEVKHMPAFAELVASFIGLVHELTPQYLSESKPETVPPFLYISGNVQRTAKGIIETIRRRKYSINIYEYGNNVTHIVQSL